MNREQILRVPFRLDFSQPAVLLPPEPLLPPGELRIRLVEIHGLGSGLADRLQNGPFDDRDAPLDVALDLQRRLEDSTADQQDRRRPPVGVHRVIHYVAVGRHSAAEGIRDPGIAGS